MTDIFISGGRALLGQEIYETSLEVAGGQISAVDGSPAHGFVGIDATGLLLLPGIVDLHGDAFERQMMPRPGVDFPIDVALIDSDRQAIANGITTVPRHHLVLGAGFAQRRQCKETARKHRSLAAAACGGHPLSFAARDLQSRCRRRDLQAAGRPADRSVRVQRPLDSTVASLAKPQKRGRMVERTGLADREFDALVERVVARAHDVPASITRLAKAVRDCGIRMLSHDDDTPEMRRAFRALGVGIAEFPVNEETAREAARGGDFIVFGAPIVVRGGSHTGWTKASDMIAKGLCSILASDYYYPAQLLAGFRLAADGILPLPAAWDLISAAPAQAAGLADRGKLTPGSRADIILVDAENPLRPRIVAVISAGRLVHLTDAGRLLRSSVLPRKAVAAA